MRQRLAGWTGLLLLVSVFAAPMVGATAAAASPSTSHQLVQEFSFQTAPAAPGVDSAGEIARATCYGGAIWQYTSTSPATLSAPNGAPFVTTNRCGDINMRKSTTATWAVSACVIFVDHTSSCNYWTDLSTSWRTIATDVRDNTRFKVRVVLEMQNASGTTAMQLAF